MLERLLVGISTQKTGDAFTYSVVVVDNDRLQSAKSTVSSFCEKSPLDITYVSEPEQNISLARNQAVRNAKGKFMVFIDDDEWPEDDWLSKLYTTCKAHDADGVLGPVRPQFESEPPKWIVKGGLQNRKEFDTGTILRNPRDTRTGNVLFAMKIFGEMGDPFDIRYGRTGGEDIDFFRRMMGMGYVFVWCNEAPVYETIPPERMKRSYFLKRALLWGVVKGKSQPFNIPGTLKSILAFLIYTSSLPFLQLAGHHLFMKYLVKTCDHIGKLLAILGIDTVKERTW